MREPGNEACGLVDSIFFFFFFAQILRPGGMFICQTYELLTRFSAGLLYIMYKLFEEASVGSRL